MFSIILSYLPYSFVTAFTPGPNNFIALYATSQSGWRKGKNVLLGIALGFLCVMVLCAMFCYELAQYVPNVAGVMKYVGAVYIVWLAIHVARSKPEEQGSKPMSFWKGFLLEFVNVKIILYAITIYTGFVLPNDATVYNMLLHALCITAVGMAGCLTWATIGGVLQKFINKYYRPFNIVMALVLVWSAISLAFDL